jgi:hypothetical protein
MAHAQDVDEMTFAKKEGLSKRGVEICFKNSCIFFLLNSNKWHGKRISIFVHFHTRVNIIYEFLFCWF